MNKANIYLLLPETNPVNQWAKSNVSMQSEVEYQRFINRKVSEIEAITIENYEGYYDSKNATNFFEHFDTLEDLYPKMKRKFQRKITN